MAAGASLLRDAIAATRSLGFRYIWIDTLCLNQDDGSEKLDQISKMHTFYSRAVLNLSATAAESGIDGMMYHRYPSTVVPLTLQMAKSDVGGDEVPQGNLIFFRDDWRSSIQGARINTRGWVFQERMLAQRVLHFARDQVYWECQSLEASETNPSGRTYGRIHAAKHLKSRLSLSHAGLSLSHSDAGASDHQWRLWRGLVNMYTLTDVTFQSDRLVALSALARRFSQVFDVPSDEYKAGLWVRHLPGSLCWTVHNADRRPKSYTAPTWSWASVERASAYIGFESGKNEVEVLDAVITVKNTMDLFGEILNGRLRVRGRVFKSFYWKMATTSDLDDPTYELIRKTRGSTTTAVSERISQPPLPRIRLNISWDLEIWEESVSRKDDDSRPEPFFLLPICSAYDWQRNHQRERYEEDFFIGRTCLVLRRTSERGQFTREGIVGGEYWEVEDSEPFPLVDNKVEYTGDIVGEEDCLQSHEDGSYTIEII